MTIIRLGYAAMSNYIPHCSPSQTMTYTQFTKIKDREAAIRKLERIAISNLHNCWRLLIHNEESHIHFFRFSSRLIPLANHPELADWNFIEPLREELEKSKSFLTKHPGMRVDFHPEHFVIINSPDKEIYKASVKTLIMHYTLLKKMGIQPIHRCVLHIGGGYGNREQALEQFIENWSSLPVALQQMILLENDDTTFTISESLYLCEKLGIPSVFDYHHFLAHHNENENWDGQWERVIKTWKDSPLPPKMHISSPKSEKEFRAHADFINPEMFMDFLRKIKGSVRQLDCMIEAKKKDEALFTLIEQLKAFPEIEMIDKGSFSIR